MLVVKAKLRGWAVLQVATGGLGQNNSRTGHRVGYSLEWGQAPHIPPPDSTAQPVGTALLRALQESLHTTLCIQHNRIGGCPPEEPFIFIITPPGPALHGDLWWPQVDRRHRTPVAPLTPKG
ncbi:hypothetical protein VULLAG_LOCUS22044 [Vulpes lagopus]